MLMWDLIHVKLCIMDWCGTKSSIRRISALKSVTQHNIICYAVFGSHRDSKWNQDLTLTHTHTHTSDTDCVLIHNLAVCACQFVFVHMSIHLCVSVLALVCFGFTVIMLFSRGVSPWLACSDIQWERPHITPLGAVCTRVAEPWPQACGVNWFSQVAVAGGEWFCGLSFKKNRELINPRV